MKAHAQQAVAARDRTNAPAHLRAGKSGSWRDHFGRYDAALLASVKDAFDAKMRGTGLSWHIGDGEVFAAGE